MSRKTKIASAAVTALLVAVLGAYAFTAPYERFPGIRIGGEPSPPPADWNSINAGGEAKLKLAGFPPFVIRIFYSTDSGGVITATRPDGGYWARRVRNNPGGWIRIGDRTYALTGREILGDARIPYLESYGSGYGMRMGYDFEGEIIPGSNEPLYTWEVFYWTPR